MASRAATARRRRRDSECTDGAVGALSIAKDKLKKAGIPADFEVRGEMLMPVAAFRKMNEERERQGLPAFANPRNFTAGTVRQLEPNDYGTAAHGLFRVLVAE